VGLGKSVQLRRVGDEDALAGVGPQAVKQLKQSANPAELQFADTPGGAGSAAVFTKLYFADISRKFRSGTLRGNTEYAMTSRCCSTPRPRSRLTPSPRWRRSPLELSSKTVSLVNLMRSLLLAHSADLGGAASQLSGMVSIYVLMSVVPAEADLSSPKRRPPVPIRQSPYWQACQAGGQLWKIESLRTSNG
jgi:hypothetical protein